MFQINGGTSFSIFPNRNIGIGTNNNEAKINIFALKQNGIIVTNYNNNGYTIKAKVNRDNTKAFVVENKNKENFVVYGNGNTGIGTNNPQAKLHVFDGNIEIENPSVSWTNTNWHVAIETPLGYVWKTTETQTIAPNKYLGYGITTSGWYWIMSDATDNTQPAEYPMSLNIDANSNALLTVRGTIRGCKVKANNLNGWCDYVFDKDYKLQSLSELEKYIKQNKHLPDMPTEKQVLENGIDLGEMNMKLLKKIEDLTLYIIEQNKRIKQLETKIK